MSFTWEFINFEISLQSRENQKFFHFLRFVVNGEERQWERECVWGEYRAGGESDIQIEEMEIYAWLSGICILYSINGMINNSELNCYIFYWVESQ